jgi:hypothetical protein
MSTNNGETLFVFVMFCTIMCMAAIIRICNLEIYLMLEYMFCSIRLRHYWEALKEEVSYGRDRLVEWIFYPNSEELGDLEDLFDDE